MVGPWILAIPLRLGRGLNDREHRMARVRRVKRERRAIHLLWPWQWKGRTQAFPLLVTLTRVSPSPKPLDDDNLAASLKAVRDQVAAELGVDDGDRVRILFVPAQERGPWGVRVEVQEAPHVP